MIAGYVRVSTQKQKNEGVSLETQKEYIVNHALRFELVDQQEEILFYIDKGCSASTLERPEISKMIEDIKSRKIDVVLTFDLSRISRDLFDSNLFLKLVKKYEVVLKCLYEEVSIDTAGDRFTTNVKVSHNQFERERVIEKTNATLFSIAEKGRYPCGGQVPFGWYRGKDKDIYVVDSLKPIIQKAFDMAKERSDLEEIKEYLNHSQSEKVFMTYQIRELLQDERYMGLFLYKDKRYTNIIPAIITKEEFFEGRHYRKWKIKKNEDYYFDDLIFCSRCGQGMSCTHSHGRNRKYYYYLCKHCESTISQNALEEYVLTLNDDQGKRKDMLKNVNKELYKLNRKIKHIREKYFDKELTDREYCSLAIAIEDRMEEYSFKKSGLKSNNKKRSYKDIVIKEEKKKYIQTTFKKIEVDPVHKKIISVKYL